MHVESLHNATSARTQGDVYRMKQGAYWQGSSMCVSCGLQARSKPIQPPTKPASAPFFLPTVPGLHSEPLFDPSAAEVDSQQGAAQPSSRVKRNAGMAVPCIT